MSLLMDTLWNNFTINTAGTGSESVTSGVLTVDGDVSNSAYRSCRYPCSEGETFILSCEAKVLTNNGTDPNPGMFIDYPAQGTNVNRIYFDSEYWKYYELKFTVTGTHDKTTDYVSMLLGSTLTTDGSALIRNPKLRTETASPMTNSIWAYAWVQISSTGVITIFEECNLSAATWTDGASAADSTLNITVTGAPTGLGVLPRPKVMGTTTGTAGYIPKTSSSITGGAAGTFEVKLLNTSTGAYIQTDPVATTIIYVEVSY